MLIHQPHGGAQGQSTDLELQIAEVVEMRRRMIDILVAATGQTVERITADIDRDYIVRGSDAVAYGLVDHIIDRRELADREQPGRSPPDDAARRRMAHGSGVELGQQAAGARARQESVITSVSSSSSMASRWTRTIG